MDDNIYMLADGEICRRIGMRIRHLRLRQDFTQMSLAEQAQISVSTLKKIESGQISSFDALMRVLRILGELDIFSPLLKVEEMSPNEYYEYMEAVKKKQRRRATAKKHAEPIKSTEEESEWRMDGPAPDVS